MAEIHYEAELKPESRAAVADGLGAFNASHTQGFDGPSGQFGLLLRHPETGADDGGLTARYGFGWMFIELLFVPERLRGKGVGRQLMADAERIAREKGLVGIRLDTFEFQARGFYEKLGYVVFGEIADHPPGSSRYFLSKRLD